MGNKKQPKNPHENGKLNWMVFYIIFMTEEN